LFGIIYLRYYLSKKKWQASDYLDFLHCRDMVYANTVVTERGLAENIKQVNKIISVGPEEVFNLSWLEL